MTDCREDELREKTHQYWDMIERKPATEYLKWYVEDLLPQELACAAQFGGKLARRSCTTLALLVGETLEPLLQAICAYRPERVVLILNERYISLDKNDRGQYILEQATQFSRHLMNQKSQLELLVQHNLDFLPLAVVKPTPARVFRALRERLRGETDVVVDITGAKKSMVAGAFLYAAYANMPVSYVDFSEERYDLKHKRPYGYACRIDFLENPYEKFALRDWERLRELYSRYNFRSARELLTHDILPVMEARDEQGEQYFEEKHVAAAKCLGVILSCYERWDNGDFHAAKTESTKFPRMLLPIAVEVLGDIWPHTNGCIDSEAMARQLIKMQRELETGSSRTGASFYASLKPLLVYAYDEVARIRRLIKYNEDYRSAFLRAAAVHEVLLYARLVGLWLQDKVVVEIGDKRLCPSQLPAEARQEIYNWVIDRAEPSYVVRCLRWKPEDPEYVLEVNRLKCNEASATAGTVQLHRSKSAPILDKFWTNTQLRDPDLFRQVRNKAIHTYLSLPAELAEAGLELAQANLREYEQNWAQPLANGFVSGELPWSEVVQLCGLDETLPPNLCQDPREGG